MDYPCSDEGPRSDRMGCTKFNEECTKYSQVRSEVGIGPQLLPYGFQNEIMDHLYLNGGLGSNKIGCTKFNEGCTKFFKDVIEITIEKKDRRSKKTES